MRRPILAFLVFLPFAVAAYFAGNDPTAERDFRGYILFFGGMISAAAVLAVNDFQDWRRRRREQRLARALESAQPLHRDAGPTQPEPSLPARSIGLLVLQVTIVLAFSVLGAWLARGQRGMEGPVLLSALVGVAVAAGVTLGIRRFAEWRTLRRVRREVETARRGESGP